KNGSIKVRKDDKVTNGEVVGLSGMTGGATGPHPLFGVGCVRKRSA
ncbi:MAG: hypothetical protein H6Q14_2887, partial [Bacteroidetes bacterium]|nr:hypothetical protein [Bacteroidota bacterium]